MATTRLALPTAPPPRVRRDRRRSILPRVGAVALGVALTIAMLIVVPIPDGPARLTLPTFIENVHDVAVPGAIAAPDGSIRDSTDTGDGSRAPAGQAGGYTGFAQSMDTSVRGALSDEIVMRVRAPEPDFWRGQTFATFDGRRWYADDDVGVRRGGPNIDIPRALGDTADDRLVPVDRFVQTFYVEADMPNVMFAAYRPIQAIVDADVWTRDDGAIRASTVLTEGSIYTVVSARPQVTAELLRSAGPRRRAAQPLRAAGAGALPGGARQHDAGDDRARRPVGRRPPVDVRRGPRVRGLDGAATCSTTSTRRCRAWRGRRRTTSCSTRSAASASRSRRRWRSCCAHRACRLAFATGYAAGTRDRVAGVYEVRASDAHAWVEVWFPETGWQAFDPTASVPLSGEVARTSVGGELAAGLTGYVGDHGRQLGARRVGRDRGVRRSWRSRSSCGAGTGVAGGVCCRIASAPSPTRRGAPGGATNVRRAASWTRGRRCRSVAQVVAEQLDRVAFDPTFDDDDTDYDETRDNCLDSRGARPQLAGAR